MNQFLINQQYLDKLQMTNLNQFSSKSTSDLWFERSPKKGSKTVNYLDNPRIQQKIFNKTQSWKIEEYPNGSSKDSFSQTSPNFMQNINFRTQKAKNSYKFDEKQYYRKDQKLLSINLPEFQYAQKTESKKLNKQLNSSIKSIENKSFKDVDKVNKQNQPFSNNYIQKYCPQASKKQMFPSKKQFNFERGMNNSRSQKVLNLNYGSMKQYYPLEKNQDSLVDTRTKFDRLMQKYDDISSYLKSPSSKTQRIIDFNTKASLKSEKTINKLNHPLEKQYTYQKKQQKVFQVKQNQQISSNLSKSTLKSLKNDKISLKDFNLGKCKGQGAFGKVFIAQHKASGMLVAIKKITKEKVKHMIDQFVTQIKLQMFLDHPNIVKLYGFFDDAQAFYIIMEYMQGGNIWNILKQKKKIEEKDTVQKLKQICGAIKQMHQNRILHRDIKPENIVLTNDVCKICDFGWAAVWKDKKNTYCGTLDYISPQIIDGKGYDNSVDIWCVGVLAYEMLCGKTPFYNINRQQTLKKITNVNYEYPAQISQTAKQFIDQILQRNPKVRMSMNQILKHQFLTK